MQVASASVSHTSTGPETRAARSSSRCWRRAIISKSTSVQTYGSPRASDTARPTSGTHTVPSRSASAARQRRRPGRLRAGDHHAPAVATRARRGQRGPRTRPGRRAPAVPEIIPGRGRRTCSMPQRSASRSPYASPVNTASAGSFEQPLHQLDVGVVHQRVVEVDRHLVPAGDHAGARVALAHPVAAQRQRDRLGDRAQHQHRHPRAPRQREVDELVVPRVRRQELAED